MQTQQVIIGTGNEDQLAAWNGDEGSHWAAHSDFYDAAVRRHHEVFMAAADVAATDRVLDVGCGNGAVAADAARVARHVTGVDLSQEMLAVAARRADRLGCANTVFLQADAQVHPFERGSFDVVLSRFGSMFFADQVGAFQNLARALAPGGRLVVMSWRGLPENEWIRSFAEALAPPAGQAGPPPEGPGPFAHAEAGRIREILTAAGFADIALEPVDKPMFFGRDADEGQALLSTSLAWMTGDVDAPAREAAFARLEASLRAHETVDGVAYGSAAWLVTARRAP